MINKTGTKIFNRFPLIMQKNKRFTMPESLYEPEAETASPPLAIDYFKDIEPAETVLVTDKITILEGKKFVLRLPSGTIYSSLTIKTFDRVMDLLEEYIGLSFITRTYLDKLHTGVFDVGSYFKDESYTGVRCVEEVAYVTIDGSTKFQILYFDDATPVCYQMPYFSTWLANTGVS